MVIPGWLIPAKLRTISRVLKRWLLPSKIIWRSLQKIMTQRCRIRLRGRLFAITAITEPASGGRIQVKYRMGMRYGKKERQSISRRWVPLNSCLTPVRLQLISRTIRKLSWLRCVQSSVISQDGACMMPTITSRQIKLTTPR